VVTFVTFLQTRTTADSDIVLVSCSTIDNAGSQPHCSTRAALSSPQGLQRKKSRWPGVSDAGLCSSERHLSGGREARLCAKPGTFPAPVPTIIGTILLAAQCMQVVMLTSHQHVALALSELKVLPSVITLSVVQVTIVLPWASTHHHQTRCFAHIVLHALLSAYPELLPPRVDLHTGAGAQRAAFAGAELLQEIFSFTEQNPSAKKLIISCPLTLGTDFSSLGHPSSVLSGRSVLVGQCELDPVECAPVSVLEQLVAFLEEERRRRRQAATASSRTLQAAEDVLKAPQGSLLPEQSQLQQVSHLHSQTQGPHGYQRKIEPWGHASVAGMQLEEQFARLGESALLCLEQQGVNGSNAFAEGSMRAEMLSATGAASLE
jgi:hypothetical protein